MAADLGSALGIEALGGSLATGAMVNNAGAIPGGRLEAVDDATWRRSRDREMDGCLPACSPGRRRWPIL